MRCFLIIIRCPSRPAGTTGTQTVHTFHESTHLKTVGSIALHHNLLLGSTKRLTGIVFPAYTVLIYEIGLRFLAMHPRYRTWRVCGIPANYDEKTLAKTLLDHESLQIFPSHVKTLKVLYGLPDLLKDLLTYPDIIQTLQTHPSLLKTLHAHPYLPQAIKDHPDLLNILLQGPHNFGILNTHPYLREILNSHQQFINNLSNPPDLQILQSCPHVLQFLETHRELWEVVQTHPEFLQDLQTAPYLLKIANDKPTYGPGGGISNGVEIYTLASDLQDHQVATVRFRCVPTELAKLKRGGKFPIEIPSTDTRAGAKRTRGPEITIDENFEGITVLRSPPQQEHSIDMLALSGLGSHPFGSFTHKGDGHMWLCKSLPRDIPGARVMIYGYDTTLKDSHSFASLKTHAASLRPLLTELLQPDTRKPLLLLGHSLGGLVIKETLIQIIQPGLHLGNTNCGLLFFGVPNNGFNTEYLVPMVNNQPNRPFLDSLGPNSDALADQKEKFSNLFQQLDLKLFCFYETNNSPTAVQASNT